MKRFLQYIKSSRSDIVLFAIFLLLLNMVAYRAFVRFDLTSPRSYSLSKASIQTVRTLEKPLSVQVFFSSNLPAPYNSVDQYVRDLLVEYKGKANRNFSYKFFDMDKAENQKIATNYKLNALQIPKVKTGEVGFQQAWMGLVFTYDDSIEILDAITSADGLEYKITTTINRMVTTTSALSGLNGKVTLTLYKTEAMEELEALGFDELEDTVRQAYEAVNESNLGKIDFVTIDPRGQEFDAAVDTYGLESIVWGEHDEHHGVLGLVLEYGGKFRSIPVGLASYMGQTFVYTGNSFLSYDVLEEAISENLKNLVSKSVEIGYLTGHGEANISDEQTGAGIFDTLISDRYAFKLLNLHDDELTNLTSVVINGPKRAFTENELYKIDQYLMRGGNLILFLDPLNEIAPQEGALFAQSSFVPIDTGLQKLLNTYGVSLGTNYVLDENCWKMQQGNYGSVPLYFAPLLQRQSLNQKHLISKNLGMVVFPQTSSIDVAAAQAINGEKVTVIAKSSPNAWLMEKNFTTNPSLIAKPNKSAMKSENLAVLVEGNFESAFDEAPTDDNEAAAFSVRGHLAKSVQSGKIFIAGSAQITSPALLDEQGEQPISVLVRNVIDYMNGEEDLCQMRTKGLSLSTLNGNTGTLANIAKYANEFGLAVLVAIAGLLVWHARMIRRRKIRLAYNPNDSREIANDATAEKGESK